MEITPPGNITILGPNAEELERLDLSYTSSDVIDGTVTLNRIICVQSTATKHWLEIVHTTNMKNLTFTLHHVTDSGDSQVTDWSKSGTSMTVSYDASPIPGSYINLKEKINLHNYANDKQHKQNYGDYTKVQVHAEPIYWLVDKPYSVPETQQPVDGLYNTYYVLTISWTEDAKETDVFYILAKAEE